MKLKILLLLFYFQIAFSQNTFPYPENASIGIGTTTPQAKLHVNNGDNSYGTILANSNEAAFSLYAKSLFTQPGYTESFRLGLKYNDVENNGFISFYRGASVNGGFLGFSTNGEERVSIITNGNVGIGTKTPESRLSVAGSLTINGSLSNTLQRPLITAGTLENGEIRGYSGAGNAYDDGFLRLSAGAGTSSYVKSFIDLSGYSTVPDMNGNIVFGTYGSERMRIDRNGYVSIGTKAPDALLTVNGTIHSSEVKVNLNFPAPDYVFKDDYNLRSLQEVENYIKENSHLPEIPSAKEFEKNGINVSEMNMALLKKIEELTLYVIEMKKDISVIKQENELLKNKK
ncbi:hypothetical protein [Flavobacterium anhuiense]|uniref:hypothetical protein n=1 Tax=Flavobacterium anhuiense TaxID=459526 RepID=UPI0034D97EFC